MFSKASVQPERGFAAEIGGRGKIPRKSLRMQTKTCHLCDRFLLAYHEGFEPPTFWSVARRSIQLG